MICQGGKSFPPLRRTMTPNGGPLFGHHSDSQGRCPGVIEGLTSGRKEIAMWRPDGGARTRIGILTPHADVWPEAEFGAMAPDGISIHAARIPFGAYGAGGTMDPTIANDPVRAFADPPLVDDAAELLASAPLRSPTASPAAATYVVSPMMPSSRSAWRDAPEASPWSLLARRRLRH